MLFNSYAFIFGFLPIVLVVYHSIRNNEKKLLWLTVASYYFYCYWNFKLAFLIFFSTLIDYVAGYGISHAADRIVKRRWLILSLITNLLLLGYFKYCNFFIQSFSGALHMVGMSFVLPHLDIVLPVGISFYTFQSMSYTIDLYRGRVEPVKNFVHFACYVSMFPQLVAGPIVRFSDVVKQLEHQLVTSERIKRGIVFFIIGLAKKVLIADTVAVIVDTFWGKTEGNPFVAWSALLAYSLQIYYDFSGYSDMAVGLGHFLGFEFPQNFNSPYKAHSITDFWRRWHMTLSQWLRDFLYIPLGGNQKGNTRTYVNLFLTMFLGGLWHGANWTFVLWGCYHGFFLACERFWRDRRFSAVIPTHMQALMTFIVVIFGWVLFRSISFHEAFSMYAALFNVHGWAVGIHRAGAIPWFVYAFLACMIGVTVRGPNTWEIEFSYSTRCALVLSGVFVMTVFVILVHVNSPFLYFQF